MFYNYSVLEILIRMFICMPSGERPCVSDCWNVNIYNEHNFIPASIFRGKCPLVKCHGSDLSVSMHRLIRVFAVHICSRHLFHSMCLTGSWGEWIHWVDFPPCLINEKFLCLPVCLLIHQRVLPKFPRPLLFTFTSLQEIHFTTYEYECVKNFRMSSK